MSRLPTVSDSTVIGVLKANGFEQKRRRGSHVFFRHPDGRTAVVPLHAGEDLGRGIVSKILKDAEIPRDSFLKGLGSRWR